MPSRKRPASGRSRNRRSTDPVAPSRTNDQPLSPQEVVHSALVMDGHPGEKPANPAPWHGPENLFLTFFFAVMMSLPLLDILARKLHAIFDWFPPVLVPGSLNLVQHSVLAIMMFGGAIAAREGKLLQLATTASLIPDRFKSAAHIITAGIGAAITLYLVKAGW